MNQLLLTNFDVLPDYNLFHTFYLGYTLKARCVTYLYYDANLNCCYEKMQPESKVNINLHFFNLGECAIY